MSRKPDYLTLCSIAAQKAGTSYGKYMAMHGYHPPIQAGAEDVEAHAQRAAQRRYRDRKNKELEVHK